MEHNLIANGAAHTVAGHLKKGSKVGGYLCSCGAVGSRTGSDTNRRTAHRMHARIQRARETGEMD